MIEINKKVSIDVYPVTLETRQQDDECSSVRQKGDPCTNCLCNCYTNYSTLSAKKL